MSDADLLISLRLQDQVSPGLAPAKTALAGLSLATASASATTGALTAALSASSAAATAVAASAARATSQLNKIGSVAKEAADSLVEIGNDAKEAAQGLNLVESAGSAARRGLDTAVDGFSGLQTGVLGVIGKLIRMRELLQELPDLSNKAVLAYGKLVDTINKMKEAPTGPAPTSARARFGAFVEGKIRPAAQLFGIEPGLDVIRGAVSKVENIGLGAIARARTGYATRRAGGAGIIASARGAAGDVGASVVELHRAVMTKRNTIVQEEAAKAAAELGSKTRALGRDVVQTESAFRRFGGVLKGVTVGGLNVVRGTIGAVIGTLFSLKGAIFGAAASFGVMSAIKLSASMEQNQIAFETMLKSGVRAEQFLKDLQAFSAKTPFEFTELTSAARRLMAFGFEAEKVIPMMTSIGDAVSGLGGGQEGIQRVILALGQMKAKSKIQAEEMLQLTEVGISGWQYIADGFGISVPEAMEKAQKGVLDVDQSIQFLLDGMARQFPNMMEKQSQTLQGLWSTVMDNVKIAGTSAGDAIVRAFDLKGVLRNAILELEKVREWFTSGGLDRVIDMFKVGFQALWSGDSFDFERLERRIKGVFSEDVASGIIRYVSKPLEELRTVIIPNLTEAFAPLASTIAHLAGLLGERLPGAAETAGGALVGLSKAMKDVSNFIEESTTAQALLVGVIATRLTPTFLNLSKVLVGSVALSIIAFAKNIAMATSIIGFGVSAGGLSGAISGLAFFLTGILTPLGLVRLAVGALATIGYVVYDNWDLLNGVFYAGKDALVAVYNALTGVNPALDEAQLKAAGANTAFLGLSTSFDAVTAAQVPMGVALQRAAEDANRSAREAKNAGNWWSYLLSTIAKAELAQMGYVPTPKTGSGRSGGHEIRDTEEEELAAKIRRMVDRTQVPGFQILDSSDTSSESLDLLRASAERTRKEMEKIPPAAEKAKTALEELGISAGTVRKALELLEHPSDLIDQALLALGEEAINLGPIIEELGVSVRKLSAAFSAAGLPPEWADQVKGVLDAKAAQEKAKRAAEELKQAQEKARSAAKTHRDELKQLANTALGEVKPAFELLFESMLKGGYTTRQMVAMVQTAISALQTVAKRSRDAAAVVIPAVTSAIEALSEGASEAVKEFTDVADAHEAAVQDIRDSREALEGGAEGWALIAEALSTLGSTLTTIIPKMSNLGGSVEGAVQAISTATNGLVGLSQAGGDTTAHVELLESSIESLEQSLVGLTGPSKEAAGAMLATMKELSQAHKDGAISAVQLDAALDALLPGFTALGQEASKARQTLIDLYRGAFDRIGNSAMALDSALGEFAKSKWIDELTTRHNIAAGKVLLAWDLFRQGLISEEQYNAIKAEFLEIDAVLEDAKKKAISHAAELMQFFMDRFKSGVVDASVGIKLALADLAQDQWIKSLEKNAMGAMELIDRTRIAYGENSEEFKAVVASMLPNLQGYTDALRAVEEEKQRLADKTLYAAQAIERWKAEIAHEDWKKEFASWSELASNALGVQIKSWNDVAKAVAEARAEIEKADAQAEKRAARNEREQRKAQAYSTIMGSGGFGTSIQQLRNILEVSQGFGLDPMLVLGFAMNSGALVGTLLEEFMAAWNAFIGQHGDSNGNQGDQDPGFQHGGSFKIPSGGSPDSRLVRFRASPGERVTIDPPGRVTGSPMPPIQIFIENVYGLDDLETKIAQAWTRAYRHGGFQFLQG